MRALLEKARGDGCGANVGRSGRDAVAAHDHGRRPAERTCEAIAELARADETNFVERRDTRRERSALVMNDAKRLADLRDADARMRMRVNDAADLRSRRVDSGVDPQLAVRGAVA